MRAKVPKGVKNDIPMFWLSNDQWLIFIVMFTGIILSATITLYEIIPLLVIAGGYLMFWRIGGERPWIVWLRKYRFRLRPKQIVRREVKGYFQLKRENSLERLFRD